MVLLFCLFVVVVFWKRIPIHSSEPVPSPTLILKGIFELLRFVRIKQTRRYGFIVFDLSNSYWFRINGLKTSDPLDSSSKDQVSLTEDDTLVDSRESLEKIFP